MLPTIPIDIELSTDKVWLRPIQPGDEERFIEIAQEDPDMWSYFSLNLADPTHLKKWLKIAEDDTIKGARRAFTIIDKATGEIAGSSGFMNISYPDLRAEIGGSWLGKAFRGTGLNKHAKFAMMQYAFETLHFERIEFKTDVLNIRARKGLEGIGGKEEGILRSHMAMWNDRRRSSIFYSVLKDEWPIHRSTIFAGIA